MEKINSFLSAVREKYSQQGQLGKILFLVLFLLAICFVCAIPVRLLSLSSRNSFEVTSTALVLAPPGTQITPTALFGYGLSPLPTLVAPTAFPTTPGPVTATQPPPTDTPPPTNTNLPPTVASSGSVLIIRVNKPEEFVELQNTGSAPVNLEGWKLISETGDQACLLKGILQPNEVLQVWARIGTTGFSCGYLINIWNDNQSDPAVLYDLQGKEVSRYP